MKIILKQIAYSRSGDKGNDANVGLIFKNEAIFNWAKNNITQKLVKSFFKDIVKGSIIRYELPNILALNFILKECLDGGGSSSLMNDAQGKTLGQAILLLELDIPDNLIDE